MGGRGGISLCALNDDSKGHSGALARIENASVYASSSKQKVMSRSSFEVERIRLHEVVSQVIGTMRFMMEQGSTVAADKGWQDNMSAIALVRKRKSTSHSRYILHYSTL